MTHPFSRTKGSIHALEVAAGFIVFSLCVATPVKLHVVLPTVFCLIGIGKSCIKLGSFDFDFGFIHLQNENDVFCEIDATFLAPVFLYCLYNL